MTVRLVALALLPLAAMTMDARAEQSRGTVRKRTTPAKKKAVAPAKTTPAKAAAPAAAAAATKGSEQAAKPAGTREAPLMQCPSVLGNGTKTQRLFCDVLIGTHPAGGLRINLPEHAGPATLFFTLHNRQVVSDESAKAPKPSFARYTASVRVVSRDGALLSSALVQSEYRGVSDLIERIAGGPGPDGVKSVAPTGAEPIVVMVPAGVREVSVLGDQLKIERLTGTELIETPGRPIAVVSQVQIEYRP